MTVPHIDVAEGGPRLSRIVPGMMRLSSWNLSARERLDWIEACLDMGITTFDHADIYGDYTCEELFGEALALEPALRKQMQLITKCGIKMVSPNRPEHGIKHYDTSKAHILASVEHSLRNLRTDYVDLLLIHRPDPLLDAGEVAEAFTELRDAGAVLHFGISNFRPWQFELLQSRLDFPLVTNQVELSVMAMDVLHDGTIDQCQRLGIAPMAWSPFAGGQIFRSDSERARRLRDTMTAIGDELGGASVDQVALAWIMRHPANIIPILGTGKPERIKRAAKATTLELTHEQWFAIWSASTGEDVP